MKTSFFPAFLLSLLSLLSSPATAQQPAKSFPFGGLDISAKLQRPPSAEAQNAFSSAHIKNIQSLDAATGFAYTRDALFRTDDGGKRWRELTLPLNAGETIGAISFADKDLGFAIIADARNGLFELAATGDGGASWTKKPIRTADEFLAEADAENALIEIFDPENLRLTLRFPTSSNFTERAVYRTADGGQSWDLTERSVEIRRSDEPREISSRGWRLQTAGSCESGKSGCVQETKIFAGGEEITPPQIKELAQREKLAARLAAENSVFASPGGATRISLNRGFDKCTAAPVSQMKTWWDNSPFYDVNIYMSGRNRGCTQGLLTADWVTQVSAMGWGLIPTIVGYQAPCSVCTNCAKHSSDTTIAETQGRGEADIAITDAANLGLLQGTVLYYDMERYDETSATPNCRASVNAFLKGWTDRLKERGFVSGVYGSPTNAVNDWIFLPEASKMHAVWLARWNNIMSVWGVAPLPDNYWTNHQRIHQWLGPRNETWGGVTFNIDNNISDAPVAGKAVAKNKPADFDGDGRTDISVFRPDAGVWYILNSSNRVFGGIGFGGSQDTIAPGDYDGDGKTDTAVFRPSEGSWYMLTKAGMFSARQFGAPGDVPVPADFNGDGKTDIAVFRPSNGVWYIANSDSLGTYTFVQFGQNGDKPVAGDYDGDGKTDLAVFRPENGAWYVLRSSDGAFYAAGFGISTDRPAQGDYDGDGKTDLAVYRSGTWYLLQSQAGFAAVSFGLNEDLPVNGDYDGDGKADIAVYRPSAGAWYILQSRDGFTAIGFGNSTDKPVPFAYLPQ